MITQIHKLSIAASLACIFSLFSLQAASAVDIPNVRVVHVSSQLSNNGDRASANTVNGSGLSGGNHDNVFLNNWLNNGPTDGQITFQLPQNFTVSNIHVWNYFEGVDTVNGGNRGLNQVMISTSTSDNPGSFSSIGTFTFPKRTALSDPGFDLTSLGWTPQPGVRRVKFDFTGGSGVANYGDGLSGLSEVRFQTSSIPAAPTPDLSAPIAGVTATALYNDIGNNRVAAHTVNGSGLSGVYPNQVHTGSTTVGTTWFNGGAPGGDQSEITFNLGALKNLGAIKIWDFVNGQISNPNADVNKATQLNIQVSSDNSTYSNLGDFTLPGRNPEVFSATNDHPGNYLDLSTATNLSLLNNVQYVRFKILSVMGDTPDYSPGFSVGYNTGLAEVQFFNAVENNAVPEPSTYALGLIGLAGLGLFAWRRRRRS